MITSIDDWTNIIYFTANDDIKVETDWETQLPKIYVNGKLVFSIINPNNTRRGIRCNVALCDDTVSTEQAETVCAPYIRGAVDIIQIKQKEI
jgi:hypothetical protein